jgi:hypothetical protein
MLGGWNAGGLWPYWASWLLETGYSKLEAQGGKKWNVDTLAF